MRYAIIKDNIVINTIEAQYGYTAPDDLFAKATDTGNIGDTWDGHNFIKPVAEASPEIVITSIASDRPDSIIKPDFSDISCPAGAILTCTAELRSQGGSVIPLTDTFRMPLRSRDGRERFVFVPFSSGLATFSSTMNESGLWSINQEAINSGLPAEKHMAMKEVQIYVCI